MPCGGDGASKARTREIERRLKKDFAEFKRELKLLLLGTGESGKSTIVKQMRIIYGKGFSEKDRQEFTVLVYRNILISMQNMLDFMDAHQIPLSDSSLQDGAYVLLDTDEKSYEDISKDAPLIGKLWADSGVQSAYDRRNEFQLSDSTHYFLTDLPRICKSGYIPSEQDLLRARQPTTGIHEYVFVLDKAIFRMLDVGGQRSERRKWIHCFENITSIIFIVASSEYDQSLVEQTDMNRMFESIALFEQIINYYWFRETSFILFLNKQDLLAEKVKKSHLKNYFPDFTGPAKDAEAAKEFILDMYLKRKPDTHDVYPHYTMATDTGNIKFVFDAVKSTILRLHLKDYNLF